MIIIIIDNLAIAHTIVYFLSLSIYNMKCYADRRDNVTTSLVKLSPFDKTLYILYIVIEGVGSAIENRTTEFLVMLSVYSAV